MKQLDVPFGDEGEQKRRPISLREAFLILTAVAALFLPGIVSLPRSSLFITDKTNTLDFLITDAPDACTTPPEIATFVIACGNGETDAVGEMRPLLTSILHLTSIPLRFVFITDEDGASRIRDLFQSLNHTQNKVTAHTIVLDEEWMATWAAQTDIDLNAHHSGMFGMSKLALPWILPPEIRLGVVLDTDMVLTKDPALLWKEALREEGEGFQKGWVYRMVLTKSIIKASQICSCVIAMRFQSARDEKVYPDKVQSILSANPKWKRGGSYKTPHGDQGVFYELWQQDKRLVGHLDGLWNRDYCHSYRGIFNRGPRKAAGILHRNCYKNVNPDEDPSTPFFEFYDAYPWHWLTVPHDNGCAVELHGVAWVTQNGTVV